MMSSRRWVATFITLVPMIARAIRLPVAQNLVKEGCLGEAKRVVFSLTTIPSRIDHIEPVLKALLEEQNRALDAVYLSLGPDIVAKPNWLQAFEDRYPSVLKVLQHEKDPGPGLKLVGAAQAEIKAGLTDSLIIYGDDDIVYGRDIVKLHASRSHCSQNGGDKAIGPRRIMSPDDTDSIPLLEATGTISVRTGAVPEAAFAIGEMPDACKFSDDYYLGRMFHAANVEFELLEECAMNWNTGRMAPKCMQRNLEEVRDKGALSSMTLGKEGSVKDRVSGDWRVQFDRYKLCGKLLKTLPEQAKKGSTPYVLLP